MKISFINFFTVKLEVKFASSWFLPLNCYSKTIFEVHFMFSKMKSIIIISFKTCMNFSVKRTRIWWCNGQVHTSWSKWRHRKTDKSKSQRSKKKKPNKKNPAINDSNQQFSHQQDTWPLYSLSNEQKRPTAKEKEI